MSLLKKVKRFLFRKPKKKKQKWWSEPKAMLSWLIINLFSVCL